MREIRIADHDYFELSNMDRQCLARFDTIGKSKAEVVCNEILKITRETSVKSFSKGINRHNIENFIFESDLVIDLCDSLGTKLLLHIFCFREKTPLIVGGSKSWPSRDGTVVRVYRYDRGAVWRKGDFPYRSWGISEKVWNIFTGDDRVDCGTLEKIDNENLLFRRFSGEKCLLGGGYDPLKVLRIASSLLHQSLVVLLDREIAHHENTVSNYGVCNQPQF